MIYPTAIGFEAAIPHGKGSCVKKASIAYAKLTDPIIWEEDEEVRYVILLAVPEKLSGDFHVKMLAELSRNLIRDDFRNSLFAMDSEDEIVDKISSLQI